MKNRGITIVSLVVTIIIIIILAGVSTNIILGDTGLITKAKEIKKTQDIVRISEKLELEKGKLAIEEYGKLDVNKYLDKIIKNQIIQEDDIYINNEQSANITVEEKYVFLVEKEEPNNIKIEYLGEPGNLVPKIEGMLISKTSNSIQIDFKLRYAEKYKLLIKEEGKEYKEEKEETVSTDKISYSFNNLNQSTTYIIKIEAESAKGAKAQREEIIELETVPSPTITVEKANTWTKEGKKVTITKKEGYTTKYTLDETIPSATNGKTYTGAFTVSDNNTKVTAVYLDSTNQIGSGATNTVTKIDKLEPTGTIETEATTNSIKVTVTATDQETSTDGKSGIKGYYYSKDNGENYTNITEETNYTFTGLNQTLEYKIKVKVEDNAGNVKELEETRKTETVPSPTITVEKANTWTKEGKKVTITKKEGYTTKYTLDETIPSATNGKTYTGAFTVSDNNTKVTAVYLDSTNQIGSGATNTVTKIDKIAPTDVSLLAGTVNNKKIVLTATATDQETSTDGKSGIKNYQIYINGNLETTITSTNTTVTYNWTSTFGDHTAYVVVTDNAGNTTTSSTINVVDYTIATKAELETFRDNVNSGKKYEGKTITQIANIDLEGSSANYWTTGIGDGTTTGFYGIYDGNNKTISNIYINNTSHAIGLFSSLTNATIKNVTIESGTVYGGRFVGGIVGYSDTNLKIINCINKATIIGNTWVGGVAGYGNNIVIENCTNNGKVLGNGYVGGIAAELVSTSINNCINTAEISGTTVAIGGIVGEMQNANVENCYNEGKIKVNGDDCGHVGGIVGGMHYKASIYRCYNKGNIEVSATTSALYVGGITGIAYTTSMDNLPTISQCYNLGNVTRTGNGECIGGIVGQNTGLLENCYNGGNISSNGAYTGGIAGLNYVGDQGVTSKILNCYNYGSVPNGPYNGGISGGNNSILENCYYLSGKATGGCYATDIAGQAEAKTSAQLKALATTLGTAFKTDTNNINFGYPILSWQ